MVVWPPLTSGPQSLNSWVELKSFRLAAESQKAVICNLLPRTRCLRSLVATENTFPWMNQQNTLRNQVAYDLLAEVSDVLPNPSHGTVIRGHFPQRVLPGDNLVFRIILELTCLPPVEIPVLLERQYFSENKATGNTDVVAEVAGFAGQLTKLQETVNATSAKLENLELHIGSVAKRLDAIDKSLHAVHMPTAMAPRIALAYGAVDDIGGHCYRMAINDSHLASGLFEPRNMSKEFDTLHILAKGSYLVQAYLQCNGNGHDERAQLYVNDHVKSTVEMIELPKSSRIPGICKFELCTVLTLSEHSALYFVIKCSDYTHATGFFSVTKLS